MDKVQAENMVYDIIAFLQKWGLWSSIDIYCGGKHYSDYQIQLIPRENLSIPKEDPPTFRDLKEIYISDSDEMGMDHYLSYYCEPPEQPPMLYFGIGADLDKLLSFDIYTPKISELPMEVQRYIIKEEKLDEDLRLYFQEYPILNVADFCSLAEFQELGEELEEQEILNGAFEYDGHHCGKEVVNRIKIEFESIMNRPGIRCIPLGYYEGFMCFEEKANCCIRSRD